MFFLAQITLVVAPAVGMLLSPITGKLGALAKDLPKQAGILSKPISHAYTFKQ